MLANLVGTFDWPATFVVIGIAGSIAIGYIGWINRTPISIQEMKLQNDRDQNAAMLARDRDVQMAKIQQNLITSHRED